MPDDLSDEDRAALLRLSDHTHEARPTWGLADRWLGYERRVRLVSLGYILPDNQFSGCWRFTKRSADLIRRSRPDDYPE